jgi:hypothetical protein
VVGQKDGDEQLRGGKASNEAPTAYDIVEQEYLPAVLNLRLDLIVDAYEPIADGAQTSTLANQRVLALILAADACDKRRGEFLRAARSLNEWIIEREGETTVHLINGWQILQRTVGLTPERVDAIRTVKRQAGRSRDAMADETELSCALLLDDIEEATYLIGQIGEKKLAVIQTWPIWNLRVAAASALTS